MIANALVHSTDYLRINHPGRSGVNSLQGNVVGETELNGRMRFLNNTYASLVPVKDYTQVSVHGALVVYERLVERILADRTCDMNYLSGWSCSGQVSYYVQTTSVAGVADAATTISETFLWEAISVGKSIRVNVVT